MENKLIKDLQEVMPNGMEIPEPIKLLYDWIEAKSLFVDTADGRRIGFLYPEKAQRESQTDKGREGGTNIEFAAEGSVNLRYWFGAEHPEVNRRLCVFAQTGAEGSMGAFWLDNENEIRIVHLGSGSGSILTCVLADNAVDFLRLLAIGYDEICWDEDFAYPPNADNLDFKVEPNVEFQNWVKSTFKVEIPATALVIVKHPTSIDGEESKDAFFNWCQKFIS
jgi:hypothetical protein